MLLPLLFASLQASPQEFLSDRTFELPHLGVSVREVRWWDANTGTIVRQARLSNGQIVNLDSLRRSNHEMGRAKYGKISHELLARMADANPADHMEVVFWLQSKDSPDWHVRMNASIAAGAIGEDARRNARDEAEVFFAPRIQAFADQLRASNYEVNQTLGAWPVVYATLPVADIRAVAASEAVDEVYFCFPDSESEMDHAQGTMRTDRVWANGMTAANSPVKTMVNDPGHVTTSNTMLPPIIKIYGNGGAASHASAVAGNIAMNHSTYKAAAWGIPQIYSADGTGDTGAPPAWNAAITTGVSFGNCSWWNFNKGAIVYLDRFFDYTIRNFGVMMFKSTGNQGTTSTPYTTSPGNGYNSTNSGSYNDGNDTNWSGDAMATYSSYWDPAEGHEKPELANAGDDVRTTSTSGFYSSFGGTSSASPLTAGVATLMATRDNALMTRTEVVKCVLMTTAWHNIEGDATLSEKDGAGGVHALAADSLLKRGNYQSLDLTAASFNPTTGTLDFPLPAGKGHEMRVCGLWFSSANSSYSTDVLDMDLDLTILDPSGNAIASSANAFNAFEILSFTPTKTGIHTIRFTKQRFDGTTEAFCVAWSDRFDTAEATVTLTGSPQVGASISLDLDSPWTSNAWFDLRLSRRTVPAFVDLGGGYLLPLAADRVYRWSSQVAGFSSNLDSAGQASVAAMIPNDPTLIGLRFFAATAILPSQGTNAPLTLSPAIAITILP